jgi:hypothetical protein
MRGKGLRHGKPDAAAGAGHDHGLVPEKIV